MDAEQFYRKVQKTPTCWLWIKGLHEAGYGVVWIDGKNRRAHRVSYEMAKGPIPPGTQLDHLCRVRRCVNPDHLEAVTQRENILRGAGLAAQNSVKTHCPQGHPLSGPNLYLFDGRRYCRTCHKRHADAYAQRIK